MTLIYLQILRHEEFEEGCKATCNGLVISYHFIFFYLTSLLLKLLLLV